jgi:hypothetical protein
MADLTVSSTTDNMAAVEQAAEVDSELESRQSDADPHPAKESAADGRHGRSGYQKRIDKLTREKYETRAEVQSLRERLEQLERARASAPAPAQTSAAEDQTPFDQQAAERPAEQIQERNETQQQQPSEEQQRSLAEHQRALNSFAEKLEADEDFEGIVERANNIRINIPPQEQFVIARAMADLKNSSEVFKYVAYHPEIAQQWEAMIRKGDPVEVIQHIHRISDALEFGTVTAQESPAAGPRLVPPAPIRPVSGSPTRTSLPLDELPYQEYKAAREKTAAARRKRGYGV